MISPQKKRSAQDLGLPVMVVLASAREIFEEMVENLTLQAQEDSLSSLN